MQTAGSAATLCGAAPEQQERGAASGRRRRAATAPDVPPPRETRRRRRRRPQLAGVAVGRLASCRHHTRLLCERCARREARQRRQQLLTPKRANDSSPYGCCAGASSCSSPGAALQAVAGVQSPQLSLPWRTVGSLSAPAGGRDGAAARGGGGDGGVLDDTGTGTRAVAAEKRVTASEATHGWSQAARRREERAQGAEGPEGPEAAASVAQLAAEAMARDYSSRWLQQTAETGRCCYRVSVAWEWMGCMCRV